MPQKIMKQLSVFPNGYLCIIKFDGNSENRSKQEGKERTVRNASSSRLLLLLLPASLEREETTPTGKVEDGSKPRVLLSNEACEKNA